MTAALAERASRATTRAPLRRRDAGAGGETTLERMVSSAWEGLVVRAVAPCPVCGGAMVSSRAGWRSERLDGSGASLDREAVGGRCRDCGSELA
jgi:hypothetical protein